MPWRRDLYRSKVDRHFEVCAESSTFFREPPGDHERASLRLPDLILPVRGMQRQEAKGLDPGRAVLTVQEKSHGEVRGSRVISARRGTHECQGAGTGQERSLLRKWPMKDNLYTVGSWKCSDGICRALLAVGTVVAVVAAVAAVVALKICLQSRQLTGGEFLLDRVSESFSLLGLL